MTQDNGWSFRWGVPLLDLGFVTIPNVFLRSYAQQGITRNEWLFVLHLAAYHFESPQGEARPSLETIASEMGYKDVRSVQEIKAGLESRGLLTVHYRAGMPSIYDVSPLSRLLLQAQGVNQDSPLQAQGVQGVNQDSPGGVIWDSPGGVNQDSPKEEKVRTKKQERKEIFSFPLDLDHLDQVPLPTLWQDIKDDIRLAVGRQQYLGWIHPTELQNIEKGAQGAVLTIACPSEYGCEALAQGNIRVPLVRAIRHYIPGEPKLCFIADHRYDI